MKSNASDALRKVMMYQHANEVYFEEICDPLLYCFFFPIYYPQEQDVP